MKAVIMAGGFGTRIQPLTSSIPKPMIPLVNRPIMLHIVELLKKHGITELVMLLYHQPQVIKNFFRDGSDFGVKITYVTPLEDMGTAGAVKCAEKYLTERFLVISGDLLTDFNLQKLVDFHESRKALATITLTSVKDPLQFGVVITDKEHRIVKFLEKPGWGEVISDTINTGIYLLEPEVLSLIPAGENYDFSQDLFPKMLEGERLYGYAAKGYWRDIGNTDSYREAHHDIFRGRINLKVDEAKQDLVGKDVRLGADVRVDDLTTLQGTVIIGDNSQLFGNVQIKDSVIGRNCTIEAGVRLSRCVIWDNVYIKKGARITDAVLCNNVRVGQGALLEEGVIVAEDTSIGDDAYLKQDVKVWPRKVIEQGATVISNMIWGERWKKTLFEGPLITGLTNVELTPEFTAKLGCAYGTAFPKGSFILGGRDAHLSSRMLKRSFIGGILSTGVNVRDLTMIPLPILRYKLKTFGEAGGVFFRQSASDPASTEILFLDGDGLDYSSSMGKGIERIFFKENFRRAHHTEPGRISELPQVLDFYREGVIRSLDCQLIRKKRYTIVIDFNHSPSGQYFPPILNDIGIEVVSLNAYVDETRGATTAEEKPKGLQQLSRIVTSLGAHAGIWLSPSCESITLVDDQGRIHDDSMLLELMTALLFATGGKGTVVVPVNAPSTVETIARERGGEVVRTKNTERSIIEGCRSSEVVLAGSLDGKFAFPSFQSAFDGLYAIGKCVEMLASFGRPLSEVPSLVPKRSFFRTSVPCVFEMKGGIMRKMSEHAVDLDASFIDGIRVQFGDEWVLVLPDQYRPLVHVYAESRDQKRAQKLLDEYRKRVEEWKRELS